MPLCPMNGEQGWLLPPTLEDLLPEEHPARFVAAFVDALERDSWIDLEIELGGEPLAAPTYHPGALVGVWLYGLMTSIRSFRKL